VPIDRSRHLHGVHGEETSSRVGRTSLITCAEARSSSRSAPGRKDHPAASLIRWIVEGQTRKITGTPSLPDETLRSARSDPISDSVATETCGSTGVVFRAHVRRPRCVHFGSNVCMKFIKTGSTALLLGLALLVSPIKMVNAQDTAASQTQNTGRDSDRGFDWGWLGLLGLAGLAGLRRREPTPSGRLAGERS